MRSTATQFREEAAAYWAGEGRNESSDPWAVARRHYFRFLAGAADNAAIDGWCAVMDRRQKAFERKSA